MPNDKPTTGWASNNWKTNKFHYYRGGVAVCGRVLDDKASFFRSGTPAFNVGNCQKCLATYRDQVANVAQNGRAVAQQRQPTQGLAQRLAAAQETADAIQRGTTEMFATLAGQREPAITPRQRDPQRPGRLPRKRL